MASDVFFVSFKTRSWKHNKINRIQEIFDKAGFGGLLKKNDLAAVKLHFGEKGNDSYINPVYVRQVVDKIKESKAKPFITDTNTLYSGSRANAIDHYITAIEHRIRLRRGRRAPDHRGRPDQQKHCRGGDRQKAFSDRQNRLGHRLRRRHHRSFPF